jgi:glycine betaine/proline transport system substrate-binding protein
MMMKTILGASAALVLLSSAAFAADAESCKTIRMFDPGWTDISSTNAIAGVLLDALGYKADIKTLSVPIGYKAIAAEIHRPAR